MEREILLIGAEGGAARHCRLVRCRPEASALILLCGDERFLLGDVRRLAPNWFFALREGEAALLGTAPDTPVDVFCRVFIPEKRPQDAGFRLDSLIVVAHESGRALETRRPGAPVVPLVQR